MEKFINSSITKNGFFLPGFQPEIIKEVQSAAVAPVQLQAAAPIAVQPAETAKAPEEKAEYITAPLVGTFYQASSPEAEAFVKPGQKVAKGQTVCLLEAMKMFSEVPAPFDCVIEECLVSDGAQVGYDAPLFKVKRG